MSYIHSVRTGRTTITYERVTARARRVSKCPICGKTSVRTSTFENTISPFNTIDDPKAPHGKRPCTRREVEAKVDALAAAWQPKPSEFEHAACTENGKRALALGVTVDELRAAGLDTKSDRK